MVCHLIAINGGKQLGVEPTMTAKEMSDSNLDHLSMMAYLAKLQHITPLKTDAEKFTIATELNEAVMGKQVLKLIQCILLDFRIYFQIKGKNIIYFEQETKNT